LLVITKSSEATKDILDENSNKNSDLNPNAYIKWKQLDMMTAKAPVEIRISGDSIATIKKVAAQVSDIMRGIEGTKWVRTDYNSRFKL
jgi:Cu/Ag efflux pump CusA